MTISDRLRALGLTLPAPVTLPPEVQVAFSWVHVVGRRVMVSGHAAQTTDGHLKGPFGPVGTDVTAEAAEAAARDAALATLSSIQQTVGSLDRIAAWLRVDGYVLVAPGFAHTTTVVNGASRLIHEVFGERVGRHARTAMGVAATPMRCSVVIAAELLLSDEN